jgi:hypothetical protein
MQQIEQRATVPKAAAPTQSSKISSHIRRSEEQSSWLGVSSDDLIESVYTLGALDERNNLRRLARLSQQVSYQANDRGRPAFR